MDEYLSPTFLKAWEEGHAGEKGSLVKQESLDRRVDGSHLDEALNRFSSPELSK